MKPFVYSSLFLTIASIGCSDETKNSTNDQAAENTAQVPPQKKENKTNSPVQKKKVAKKNFNPLQGKSMLEICQSDGLSLIKFSFEERQAKTECCSNTMSEDDRMTLNCELDWPSSDIPGCSMYDEMRNEIFARYGRKFSPKKWQRYFAKQKWYVPRDDYTDAWLSKTAQANVQTLIKMKKDKVACMD